MNSTGVNLMKQSPYSPDLNLCDRFVFYWLKNDFQHREFIDHSDVEANVLRWARGLNLDALQNELKKLQEHCLDVINAGGDYITP